MVCLDCVTCILYVSYSYYCNIMTCLIPLVLLACSVFHTKLNPPSLPPLSLIQTISNFTCALIEYLVCSIRGKNFCQNIYHREVSRNQIRFQPGFPFILIIARQTVTRGTRSLLLLYASYYNKSVIDVKGSPQQVTVFYGNTTTTMGFA